MLQLKQISIKPRLKKNWKIFADVLKSKSSFKILTKRLALLKKTYSENQQTKPGFQVTIATTFIQTFIEAIRSEINNEIEKTTRTGYSNLSVKEQKALLELQSRDGIVIKEAEKGGAVVILDVEDYIKDAERQLHSTENYKILNHNPTTTNKYTLNKKVKRFYKENLISKNIAKGLKIESHKSPHFYLKPKVHKEGVPGRPFINSVNCYTSKISEYIDYRL